MADFLDAYQQTIANEGGYVNDPDDPGGETYKGVARTRNPKWAGWVIIDSLRAQNLDSNGPLQRLVHDLYRTNYWDKVCGNDIEDQDIADSIFDFAVNAGPRTSSKLAQITVGAQPDGIIGPTTLDKINEADPRAFIPAFALAKIARYVSICERRSTSKKYFFGWIRRTLEAL